MALHTDANRLPYNFHHLQ